MKKINIYLFYLTNKYLIVNFLILSIFIIFINLLEYQELFQKMIRAYLILFIFHFLNIPQLLTK